MLIERVFGVQEEESEYSGIGTSEDYAADYKPPTIGSRLTRLKQHVCYAESLTQDDVVLC